MNRFLLISIVCFLLFCARTQNNNGANGQYYGYNNMQGPMMGSNYGRPMPYYGYTNYNYPSSYSYNYPYYGYYSAPQYYQSSPMYSANSYVPMMNMDGGGSSAYLFSMYTGNGH